MPASARPPTRPPKAPFPWYGGKQYLADTIASLLPPHAVYVELCGGAASLLFTKPASALEVYNDIDSGLVHFFRVLRDPLLSAKLQRQLELTPYSREEWAECAATWSHPGADAVEQARRYFVAITGSFGKHMGSGTGWSYSATAGHDKAHAFRAASANLAAFSQRLRYVQVEHNDFAKVIAAYDAPHTLFYCDPPYLPETRTRNDRYRHEMTSEDHQRLLHLLTNARGMVILSGYRSALYDEALVERSGWSRRDIPVHTWSSNRRRDKRVESVWLNPATGLAQPSLFTNTDETHTNTEQTLLHEPTPDAGARNTSKMRAPAQTRVRAEQ